MTGMIRIDGVSELSGRVSLNVSRVRSLHFRSEAPFCRAAISRLYVFSAEMSKDTCISFLTLLPWQLPLQR